MLQFVIEQAASSVRERAWAAGSLPGHPCVSAHGLRVDPRREDVPCTVWRVRLLMIPSLCHVLPGQWSWVQWRRDCVSPPLQGSNQGVQQRVGGEAGGGEYWFTRVGGMCHVPEVKEVTDLPQGITANWMRRGGGRKAGARLGSWVGSLPLSLLAFSCQPWSPST